MKRLLTIISACFLFIAFTSMNTFAQGSRPQSGGNMSGRMYGKVVEDASGKNVEFASVQLWQSSRDTVTKQKKDILVAGQLTASNGEFSFEGIPAFGEYSLKISYLGFNTLEQKVSFGFTKGSKPDISKLNKDLGNLKLVLSETLLKEVTVTGERSGLTLALDKKVYRVDKNAVSTGGTAEDALRNMPAVSVDIDGNVSLRNSSPEIFVDGRPTTLTIDQISADAIEQIELITNPSAKFDAASGGSSGIINIVLKKEKRLGINGSLRAGTDTNLGANAGVDINIRQGKFNTFLNGNFMRRVSYTTGETERLFYASEPDIFTFQSSMPSNKGNMFSTRLGFDWFLNNRNTLTLALNANKMKFDFADEINTHADTLYQNATTSSNNVRKSDLTRQPQPLGAQLLFKHLFPKEGKELTADITLNNHNFKGNGSYETIYSNNNSISKQLQENESKVKMIIAQADYVTPLNSSSKIETGIRLSYRDYTSDNIIKQYDTENQVYIEVPQFANRYGFLDQVYAAYATYQKSFTKFGYQVGLRAESSKYDGRLLDSDTTFNNKYPISIFPSLYLSYKLNESNQLLLNFSRKINRPSFWQLLPYSDFSDSLLLSRGNPGLKPEFVHNVELSYQNSKSNGNSLLVSLYARYVSDIITRYQFSEYNAGLNRTVLVSSYENANSSFAYGVESNFRNVLFKMLELNTNVNLYDAIVNADNIAGIDSKHQLTLIAKESVNVRLPKQWSVQVTGEYQ
nr:TonB-dependent receptor [Saprospiraceae bacterium]